MQAIILAGGKGSRLKPYTTIFPKPLMPIGEYPVLEIILRQLKQHGFNDITLAVGYLKELLQAYFNHGEKWGLKIHYSHEDKPLGTAAPLKLIKHFQDNFLVMNGDVLTTLNFSSFIEFHQKRNSICTIAMFNKPVKIDLGILETNDKSLIIDYIEKPTLNYKVSMGVYVFNKRILDFIPYNSYLDLPDLIKLLIRNGEQVNGYNFEGDWLDIGRHEDYEIAHDYFEKNQAKFLGKQ
jgi:NDP-mannose synthase